MFKVMIGFKNGTYTQIKLESITVKTGYDGRLQQIEWVTPAYEPVLLYLDIDQVLMVVTEEVTDESQTETPSEA